MRTTFLILKIIKQKGEYIMETLTSIIMEQQAIISQRAEKMTFKQMEKQQKEFQEVIAGNKEILKKLKSEELEYKKGYVKTFRFLDMLDISQSAKLLFGHIESLMNLSNKNATLYKDKHGDIFCYFTIKRVAQTLSCCEKTAVKLMKELEESGLIIKVRQGNHLPNRIYLTKLSYHLIRENTSALTEELNKNKNKKVQKVKIKDIGREQGKVSLKEKEELLKEKIKVDIGYNVLISKYNKEMVNEIYHIIFYTLTSNAKYFCVSGCSVDADKVKDVFSKLNQFHIEYVLESLCSTHAEIKNVKNYLVTTLFNSLQTYNIYYSMKVNKLV